MPRDDHSIEHEPHLAGGYFEADPSEDSARRVVDQAADRQREADRVDHAVWDEPALSAGLAGDTPEDAVTYARWLDDGRSATTARRSWAITALLVVIAGPLGVIGALSGGGGTWFALLTVIVFAPLVEEITKVAGALWVVERRPYWFRSRLQIVLCTLGGGLGFAAIENLLYLNVYVPDPPAALVVWRWTVCVALHMGCSLIAGMGLMAIWSKTTRTRTKPDLGVGSAYFVTAIVLHGSYNAFATFLELSGFEFAMILFKNGS